jgi:hypothetical protein
MCGMRVSCACASPVVFQVVGVSNRQVQCVGIVVIVFGGRQGCTTTHHRLARLHHPGGVPHHTGQCMQLCETGEQCSLKSMSLFCDTAHCCMQPITFSHLRDAMLLRATRLGCVVGRAAGRSAPPASARWYAVSAKNVKVSRRLLMNEDWLGG